MKPKNVESVHPKYFELLAVFLTWEKGLKCLCIFLPKIFLTSLDLKKIKLDDM